MPRKPKVVENDSTTNIEAALKENAVPFVDESQPQSSTAIILPGSAFFDQELGDVIFNKLMKAPVKDYQVLLRLSKLGRTVNEISHKLSIIRDAIAKEAELDPTAPLTPEVMSSAEYQEKTKKFGELLQKYVFTKHISLEPLGTLKLDLTNPDGHAKAFLEGSNLSADDIDMLNTFNIVEIKFPEEDVQQAEHDILVPNSNE